MLWRVEGGWDDRYPAEDAWSCLASAFVLCPVCRLACRDIGGSDPERMAAPRVAEYVEELFKNSPVEVAQSILMCANKRNVSYFLKCLNN